MVTYHFSDKLMLRSPLLSFKDYAAPNVAVGMRHPIFQTALYLANPQLYRLVADKQFDYSALTVKERLSILKYLNRMCFRPTPFGAFSSFCILDWGKDQSIQLDSLENARLHLMLDQDLALRLANSLTLNELREATFVCNPTLYQINKEYRFIKTNTLPGKTKLSFSLESYEYNGLIASIIDFCCEQSRTGAAIIAHIAELAAYPEADAEDYLRFLVHAQLILPDTLCNMVGTDFIRRIAQAGTLNFAHRELLKQLDRKMAAIQWGNPDHLTGINREMNALLLHLNLDTASQTFYAGVERRAQQGSLDVARQSQIREALTALQLLVPQDHPPALQQFIRDFKAKYDRQKVPLLQALDPETGITYGGLIRQAGPELLQGIQFMQRQEERQTLHWSAAHRLLMDRWCHNPDTYAPLRLTSADLPAIPVGTALSMPPSLTVMFRVIDQAVFLESIGGISGTAMIGRFTAWSKDTLAWSREIVRQEEMANPDVIFAEIGQLSDSHVDNISRREQVYRYEIPVNTHSILPPGYQLALTDLWLSVVDDRLVLESARLQKEVIPRLSSAYNFQQNQLSVFRLLCDLQYQGLQSNLTFDLERFFPGMPFYPRVCFNQTILAPAKWWLSAEQAERLCDAAGRDHSDRFNAMLLELSLPDLVALTRHDQQLVFNLRVTEEVRFFADCIKGLPGLKLQEFLLPESSFLNSDGLPLVNQFVSVLYRKDKVYDGRTAKVSPSHDTVKRDHRPGSKWIYLKLYCSPAIANNLLVKKIWPLVAGFKGAEVSLWFFIRYYDSGYHIRLRLKVKEKHIGKLLNGLKRRLTDGLRYPLIREYQADTYQQELERYGQGLMAAVEGFFAASSELVVQFISKLPSGPRLFSYHSLAFVSVNEMLMIFLPHFDRQLDFLQMMSATFFMEFSGNKALRIGLDMKYRRLKTEVESLLKDNLFFDKLKLRAAYQAFRSKLARLARKSNGRISLLADLVHMHLNRLFVDQQRKQELIVYYCLHKYWLSKKAIRKPGASA